MVFTSADAHPVMLTISIDFHRWLQINCGWVPLTNSLASVTFLRTQMGRTIAVSVADLHVMQRPRGLARSGKHWSLISARPLMQTRCSRPADQTHPCLVHAAAQTSAQSSGQTSLFSLPDVLKGPPPARLLG